MPIEIDCSMSALSTLRGEGSSRSLVIFFQALPCGLSRGIDHFWQDFRLAMTTSNPILLQTTLLDSLIFPPSMIFFPIFVLVFLASPKTLYPKHKLLGLVLYESCGLCQGILKSTFTDDFETCVVRSTWLPRAVLLGFCFLCVGQILHNFSLVGQEVTLKLYRHST